MSRHPLITLAVDPEPYLIGTLYFEDMATMRRAFTTPEGQACAEIAECWRPTTRTCRCICSTLSRCSGD